MYEASASCFFKTCLLSPRESCPEGGFEKTNHEQTQEDVKKRQKLFAKSRIPRPTDDWFRSTFNVMPSPDIVYLVWYTLINNACGRPQLLASTWLDQWFSTNRKSKVQLIKTLYQALDIPPADQPTYWEGHCRHLEIPKTKAQKLIKEWYRNIAHATGFRETKDIIEARIDYAIPSDHPLADYQYYLNKYQIQYQDYNWDAALDLLNNDQYVKEMEWSEDQVISIESTIRAAKDNHNKGVIYKLEKNRFYSVGPSIQNVKSELRKAIMPLAIELDLRYAHVAIVAKEFEIPALHDAIINVNWRNDIADFIGCDTKCVKLACNATVYGAGQIQRQICFISNKKLRDDIQNKFEHQKWSELIIPLDAKVKEHKFSQIPIIADLIETIKCPKKDISKDVFGYEIDGDINKRIHSYAASIEKKIMMPIYEAAINGKIDIIAEQHDGVSVIIRDDTTIDQVMNMVDPGEYHTVVSDG